MSTDEGNSLREGLVVEYYSEGKNVFGSIIDRILPLIQKPHAEQTILCNLMTKYGSDKYSIRHFYSQFYHPVFSELVPTVRNLFEVGLGTNNVDVMSNMGANGKPGASLRAWRDYMPTANIYGADVDERILFQEDRISTFYVDQLNTSTIDDLWRELINIEFDIMIDDGLHTFEANKNFLENSIHKLRPGGIYIIEDIIVTNKNLGDFSELLKSINLDAVLLSVPFPENNVDNCIVAIRK